MTRTLVLVLAVVLLGLVSARSAEKAYPTNIELLEEAVAAAVGRMDMAPPDGRSPYLEIDAITGSEGVWLVENALKERLLATGWKVKARPAAPDTTPPSVPTGLVATVVSTNQINLSWSAATDTGGSGLAGYKIYRAGVPVATVTGTSYSSIGLSANTQYCHTVAAYDKAGNTSSPSSPACATPLKLRQRHH